MRSHIEMRVNLSGFKTSICCSHGMMYWFYIQLPCKGWMEFDIRGVKKMNVDEESDWSKYVVNAGHNEILILEKVSEKIKHLSIKQFNP